MATNKIKIEVRIAWWFRCYMFGLWCMARILKAFCIDASPNPVKVRYWAERSVNVYVNGNRVKR
jgi:hypothetical protein